MLRVKLKQLKSKHKNLRTAEIIGKCTHIPEVGYGFDLYSDSLTGVGIRVIKTSEVTEIEHYPLENFFVFKTRNSTYELAILDEDKDPFDYMRVDH